MKSKTAERILSETPQETKDKVRETANREVDLLRLGFEVNANQTAYILLKYDKHWYVDFWKIRDYMSSRWNTLIDDLIYDQQTAKKQFYVDLKESDAYVFAQKEFKKQILDKLNKYRSWFAEETRCKMGRNPNFARELELKSKVKVLIELQNKLK
jgi:hypothetical protein